MFGSNAADTESITANIHILAPGRALGDHVYTLTTPATLIIGINDFGAPLSAALSANTNYLLVITNTGNASNDFNLAAD